MTEIWAQKNVFEDSPYIEWTTSEQPSIEISKDLEPSKTLGDFYLQLLKQEISRFKGK